MFVSSRAINWYYTLPNKSISVIFATETHIVLLKDIFSAYQERKLLNCDWSDNILQANG